MSFSTLIKQKNILLIPFSWMYKAGAFIYHGLYDLKILKSTKPSVATICIGNLSVGGTGKSPMVEYLIRLLKNRYKTAVVSRGYKRKTKGFLIAKNNTTASDIGDEPMQFHTKFPEITIAVGEQRATAIQQLMNQQPQTEVVILDDAFQHRKVQAGFNILLTEYGNRFTRDWYLPAGSLRDLKGNYKRANIILVTKTNPDLSEKERQVIIKEIRPLDGQQVFFTKIQYGTPYQIFSKQEFEIKSINQMIVVTGIANPHPLLEYLGSMKVPMQHIAFGDHYDFSENDIVGIVEKFSLIDATRKVIVTTEKDAMRLRHWPQLQDLPVFAIPIEHKFLFNEEADFNKLVSDYVLRTNQWLA